MLAQHVLHAAPAGRRIFEAVKDEERRARSFGRAHDVAREQRTRIGNADALGRIARVRRHRRESAMRVELREIERIERGRTPREAGERQYERSGSGQRHAHAGISTIPTQAQRYVSYRMRERRARYKIR